MTNLWYKLALNNVDVILDKNEKLQHINSKSEYNEELKDDSESGVLENQINKVRKNVIENPNLKNEAGQPNNYFAHGQGGDYRLQEGRDQPWNQSPDNFTTPTPWNNSTR